MPVNIIVESRIQPRSIFKRENPILPAGEIGIEKELTDAKMGDGVTDWEHLSSLKVPKEVLEKWYNIITSTSNSRLITLPDVNFAYTTVNVDSNPLVEDVVSTVINSRNYCGLTENKKEETSQDFFKQNYNTMVLEGNDIFDFHFLTELDSEKITEINCLGFQMNKTGEMRYYVLKDAAVWPYIESFQDHANSVSYSLNKVLETLYSENEEKPGLCSLADKYFQTFKGGTGHVGMVPGYYGDTNIARNSAFLHCSGDWVQINGNHIKMPISLDNQPIEYAENSIAKAIIELQNKEEKFLEFEDANGLGANAPNRILVAGIKQEDLSKMYYHANVYINGQTGVLFGAAYNDYAEARKTNNIPAGRVVVENGDDTLSISTERLMLGGNIVSDTYGMLIGETDDAKTPIALCGRVLAYPLENKEEYYPGAPVCTGPNGTVSIMSKEEVLHYPECIIGYVSAIPNYEEWNNKKVDGRIWIKVV